VTLAVGHVHVHALLVLWRREWSERSGVRLTCNVVLLALCRHRAAWT
jgi:hypothetical protein